MSELARLGIQTVINATGPWTKIGNAAPAARVRAAMDEMAAGYAPIAELQELAAGVVAQVTGSESGYVTPGAAAAVTLSVAACVAGEDPDRIRALPHLTESPHTVVMFQRHRWLYDIAVRATGVRLRTVDADGPDALDRFATAIDSDVACVFYDCTGAPYRDPSGIPKLVEVVQRAHERGARVVVDASMALPPADNLTAIVATGADAVAFSGGKAIEGPPASGFVACRADMVRSMALQHQDLNVWAEITGRSDPDNLFTGLGRGLKVGKEQIVGLIVALRDYAGRDHAGLDREWHDRLARIVSAVEPIVGVAVRWQVSDEGRAPYLMIGFEGPLSTVAAGEVSQRLLAGQPRIFAAAIRENVLLIGPENLRAGEPEIVGRRIAAIIQSQPEQPTGQRN